MIDVKAVAGGIALAGSLGLAVLGFGAGVAGAEPAPGTPVVTTTQDGGGHAPVSQSPYAAYGNGSICGSPGLYFVNVCS